MYIELVDTYINMYGDKNMSMACAYIEDERVIYCSFAYNIMM